MAVATTTRDYSLTGRDARLAVENGLSEAQWYVYSIPRKELKDMMKRKDSPALRDTALISNDSQQTLLVFVSRDVLLPAKDGSRGSGSRRRALRRGIRADFDPIAVMRELGEMVLVGKSVQYVNRIQVAAGVGKNSTPSPRR